MKRIVKDFKDFIFGANIIGLATGVIIGAAGNALVTSLVDDIIMPIVGILMGGKDFKSLSIKVGSATILYGQFIQNLINFIIIMFCAFFIIKIATKISHNLNLAKKAEHKPTTESYLKEIRDILKAEKSNS